MVFEKAWAAFSSGSARPTTPIPVLDPDELSTIRKKLLELDDELVTYFVTNILKLQTAGDIDSLNEVDKNAVLHILGHADKSPEEKNAALRRLGNVSELTAPEKNAVLSRLGNAGELTEKEKEAVIHLRMMLQKKQYVKRLDALTLLRFLRACKFNINQAYTKFHECEKWRESIELDKAVATWSLSGKSQVAKEYIQYYHNVDKDGRPVYIEKIGSIDTVALKNAISPAAFAKNIAVEYERVADIRLPACSHKAKRLIETCCTIMDLRGAVASDVKVLAPYLNEATQMSQNYYPERLGRMYIIDPPTTVKFLIRAALYFMDQVTRDKIEIISSSKLDELKKQIREENLPQEIGGTCVCPGSCRTSDIGPWQDKEWSGQQSAANVGAGVAGAPPQPGAPIAQPGVTGEQIPLSGTTAPEVAGQVGNIDPGAAGAGAQTMH